MALSVGDIAGLIAAGIFVLGVLVPNSLIVVLVGLLKTEHSAVTWSVVQRELLSCLWPTLLRSDAAASKGVNSNIKLFTYLRPILLVLIAVAGIVTPLGLYQDVVPDKDLQYLPMRYIPDLGPMGYGTPARSGQGFTRSCGDFAPMQCPGTNVVIDYNIVNETGGTFIANSTVVNDNYDMRIPKVLAELYQSGLTEQNGSVSSFFDIQTRQYGYGHTNQKKPYIVDSFRYLTSVILDDTIEPFEGLVVDTVKGGIGFRNHTAPLTSGVAAEWYEDLLWIEPETVCVNTNLSLEATVPWGTLSPQELLNITLIDEGGFANIDRNFTQCDVVHTQKNPQLQCRAYRAAWMTNVYTMLIMNLTRPGPDPFGYLKSHVGARFPLASWQSQGVSLTGISIDGLYQALVSTTPLTNYSIEQTPGANYGQFLKPIPSLLPSNPFNIQSTNFSDLAVLCQGAGGRDYTNMTNIQVQCGLMFGAAKRADGSETLIYEPGTVYKQPIYSCASTNKASIKTVHFRYNTTQETEDSIKALSVLSVQPKQYSDQASMPIWGIETVPFALHDLQQLWGLISPEMQHAVNLSTVQQEHLYLPGYGGTLMAGVDGFEYIPGNTGPSDVLSGVFESGISTTSVDYTGATNMAMYVRWREMSQNETTMPKVINLIWTDIAANLMMGTRSWNTPNRLPPNLQKRDVEASSSSSGQRLVPVTVYRQKVRYHWYFGIPAFLCLALTVVIVVAAIVMMLLGRGGPSRIRFYLSHLSAGRLLALIQYPGTSDTEASTKQWIKDVGERETELQSQRQMTNTLASPYSQQLQTTQHGAATRFPFGQAAGISHHHDRTGRNASASSGKPHKGYVTVQQAEDQESNEGLWQAQ